MEIVMVKRKLLFSSCLVKPYPACEGDVCLGRGTCIAKDEKECWSSVNFPKVLVSRGKETLMSLRRRKQANKQKKPPWIFILYFEGEL